FAQVSISPCHIQILPSHQSTSLRGMSVVNDQVIWVSGSNGTVGRSTNGGETWQWCVIKGFEKADFRSLVAFSDKKAVILNAGSPAHILITADGGATWKEVYTNTNKDIFFDGMAFWNDRRGIAVSDPLNGKFFFLQTKDGGRHWRPLPAKKMPAALPGEACFAASNTILVALQKKYAWLASGGAVSHVFFSKDHGRKWKIYHSPILQGKSSAGIFSMAFRDRKNGIIAGGDYLADSIRINNAFLTGDGGKSWQRPVVNPYGYRSCVAWCTDRLLIATGPSGTDISTDGGTTWKLLSKEGFNVVQKAKNANAVYLAGADGKLAKLALPVNAEISTGF
ncbi:MAG TPA: YCF48-related protein, partial [Chitinophagaceae bacterium]